MLNSDLYSLDALWPAMLATRSYLGDLGPSELQGELQLTWRLDGSAWQFAGVGREPFEDAAARSLAVRCQDDGRWRVIGAPGELRDPWFPALYLELLAGQAEALRRKRVFVSSHLALTIDGRIATKSGHSRWISNYANRVHAHRLRALHDAVLVGADTVRFDDPKLTVRHVPGNNPVRVVLEGRNPLEGDALGSLRSKGTTWLISPIDGVSRPEPEELPEGVTRIRVEAGPDAAVLSSERILQVLSDRGIRNLFIEGGGRTVSHFLGEDRIDSIHVHFAPLILGSGRSGFVLPEARTLDEAKRFQMTHYDIDGEVLLVLARMGDGASG